MIARRVLATGLLALLPATALGFTILQRDPPGTGGSGVVRFEFVTPVPYRHNPSGANPAGMPGWVDEAFATWAGVPSASIAFTRGTDTTAAGLFDEDGISAISYEDPDDQLETGVLAATAIIVPTNAVHAYKAMNFYRITEADIAFNDGVEFTDTNGATILGGCLGGRFDTEAVALHEIGHFFGLDHSAGAQYGDAIMFPSIADCDATRTSPKPDDIDGVTFLYDSMVPPVYPAFNSGDEIGYAPHSVSFTDQTTGSVTSYLWDFGDGGTSSAASTSHEYTAPGIYDVSLTVNGTATIEKENLIQVILEPEPDFTSDVTEGDAPLTVVFANLTNNPGADPDWEWQFSDGTEAHSENPTHVFDEPGTYSVRLRVDAGAGFVNEDKDGYIHVKGEPKDELFPGCTCAVAERGRAPWASLAIFALGLFALRRRR